MTYTKQGLSEGEFHAQTSGSRKGNLASGKTVLWRGTQPGSWPIFVFKDALILMVLFSSILCHVFTLAVANASQLPTPAHPFWSLFQRSFVWYNFSHFWKRLESSFASLLSCIKCLFSKALNASNRSVSNKMWMLTCSTFFWSFSETTQFSSVLAFLKEVPWTPVKFCHCFLPNPTMCLTFAPKAADNLQRSGCEYVKLIVHRS